MTVRSCIFEQNVQVDPIIKFLINSLLTKYNFNYDSKIMTEEHRYLTPLLNHPVHFNLQVIVCNIFIASKYVLFTLFFLTSNISRMQNIMFKIFNTIKYIFGSNKVKKLCERRWNDYDETKFDKKIKGTLAHDVYTERYFTFIRSLYKKKVFLALTFPLTMDTDNNVAQITVQCAYTIYNIYICIYIQKRSLDLQTDVFLFHSLSLSLFLSTHTHTHCLSLSLSFVLSHILSLPFFFFCLCATKSRLSFGVSPFVLTLFSFFIPFFSLSFFHSIYIRELVLPFFFFYLNKIKLAVTISG